VEIRLFGEVELWVAGQVLDVGTPRRHAVLAALIVDAGRPVAIEALIDRIWDESPPVEARNVLYSHLSGIRQLLVRAADLTVSRWCASSGATPATCSTSTRIWWICTGSAG
jgi:DNA-binding SARP family transcriptional activator